MKKTFFIVMLGLLSLTFNNSLYAQRDHTFCYGAISLTLFDGGKAEMIRYNSSRVVVSRVLGEYDLYGKGSPTEVLKINFQGTEYRYDLIRDGMGNPSKLYDNQMREYTICKSSQSTSTPNNTSSSNNPNSEDFVIGTFDIPEKKMKIKIFKESGVLTAEVYQQNSLFKFNTKCGLISTMVFHEKVSKSGLGMDIYLTPKGCSEPEDPATWKPNFIMLSSYKDEYVSKCSILDISIYSSSNKILSKTVKKIKL